MAMWSRQVLRFLRGSAVISITGALRKPQPGGGNIYEIQFPKVAQSIANAVAIYPVTFIPGAESDDCIICATAFAGVPNTFAYTGANNNVYPNAIVVLKPYGIGLNIGGLGTQNLWDGLHSLTKSTVNIVSDQRLNADLTNNGTPTLKYVDPPYGYQTQVSIRGQGGAETPAWSDSLLVGYFPKGCPVITSFQLSGGADGKTPLSSIPNFQDLNIIGRHFKTKFPSCTQGKSQIADASGSF